MARTRYTQTLEQPSGIVLTVKTGAPWEVRLRGLATPVTFYSAETGGSAITGDVAHLTTRNGRVEPAATVGGELWLDSGIAYDEYTTANGQAVSGSNPLVKVGAGGSLSPSVETSVATNTANIATNASAISALAVRMPFFNVKDATYGAVGDNSHDDTTNIQAAIDACAAAGGGTVYFPPGIYKTTAALILKAHVVLTSGRKVYGNNALSAPNSAEIRCATAGEWTVDTVGGGTSTYGCGIHGLDVFGSSTAKGGIRLQQVRYGSFEAIGIAGYLDQGLLADSACIACSFDEVNTVNCVVTTARAAAIGAVEIDGTDHFLSRIEAASYPGAVSGPIDSTNFWITGIYLKATNCQVFGCIGETSDYGWRVSGNENRFSACRGDTNWAGDWIVSGARNAFSSCTGLNSARAASNTYDSWIVSATPNSFSSCGCSNSGTGRTYRYGFRDTSGSLVTQRNRYAEGCFALNCATRGFNHSDNTISSGFGVAKMPVHPADTTVTPDVTGTSFLVLNLYATPTTINGFVNGVGAQELTILPTTANVTLAHNALGASVDGNILTSTRANKKLVANRLYRFQRYIDQWYEIPDPHVLVGSTTWDPASLTTGSSERKSVTVTGAAVGDPAFAGLTTIAATGWDITAAVIAADTVEVKITNNTGGTVDLASGTVRANVVKVT